MADSDPARHHFETLYVANSRSNTVSVIVAGTKTKDIKVEKSPCVFAVQENILHIANSKSGTVSMTVGDKKTQDITLSYC
ncbi:hypothetical protein [Candidatus Paracaedibacter symbiosus]|uniref:hypothetical protein n=1 Tax=Candidatus Paracaedibacter symbiosus TaxID=244582 RepID=UPI0012EC06FD|nr:hypothetical protein [Candidatus Paracaedibacter symbiosus]